MNLNRILTKNIDEVNKRIESDDALVNILNKYEGRCIVINIKDEMKRTIQISKNGLSFRNNVGTNQRDMYVEMDRNTLNKIIRQDFNFFQIMTMVFLGKIKIRNIGAEEIDLVRRMLYKESS